MTEAGRPAARMADCDPLWRECVGPLGDAEREALFRELTPLVRRLVRQYGDEPELRRDLEGELCYRFCALLESYDPQRGVPLRPYLIRQLISSAYTYARGHWRRRRREVSLEESLEAETALGCLDPTREWDDRLACEQLARALPRALEQLPHRQRQVILWRYYESCSYGEIAELLGVREATARSIARHALSNLRRHLPLMRLGSD